MRPFLQHGRPDLKKDLKGMFDALNAVWEEAL